MKVAPIIGNDNIVRYGKTTFPLGRHSGLKLKQRHSNRQRGAKLEPPRVKSSHYRTRVRAADWR